MVANLAGEYTLVYLCSSTNSNNMAFSMRSVLRTAARRLQTRGYAEVKGDEMALTFAAGNKVWIYLVHYLFVF